jgi:hypothetical protein
VQAYQNIKQKLDRFIRKYYVNELIKGVILFLSAGLLYLILTTGIEYFFWLDTVGRSMLFWSFVAVELFLFVRFIVLPCLRLFRLSKGIDYREAGNMIGSHFPEVSDKLINLLQLNEDGSKNELVWASIEQRSDELKPIPFSMAVNFQSNVRYLPYLILPILLILIVIVTGYQDDFKESANRIADFSTEYTPPAPFEFFVDQELRTLKNQRFTLTVKTLGEVVPSRAMINYEGKNYFMKQAEPGLFKYSFENPVFDINFKVIANDIQSNIYILKVEEVPIIQDFTMSMDYPAHTGRADQVLKNMGSATIPEGTKVKWNFETQATTQMTMAMGDQLYQMTPAGKNFLYEDAIERDVEYSVKIGNSNVSDYETLTYNLRVVRDEHPEIKVIMRRDSLVDQVMHFKGEAADDYGISRIRLVYYDASGEGSKNYYELDKNLGNFSQFLFSFPGPLELKQGATYEFYFEVIDNDAVNNFKSARTEVFSLRKPTQEEQNDQQLKDQQKSLEDLERNLQEQQKQKKELEELTKEQLEKTSRTYNEKQRLEQFLKAQQDRKKEMRQQLKKLEHQLQNYNEEQNNETKENLEERIQKTKEELKKEEELLKELRELQEKLSNEQLMEKLQKMQQKNQQQERNLEQMLELTRRYYVTQKFEQLAETMEKMAEEQEKESGEHNENEKQAQEKLNDEFEDWKEELKEWEKQNSQLKEPMKLEADEQLNEEIDKQQQDASDALEKEQSKKAQQKQKNASDAMKEQAKKMAQQAQTLQANTMQEDAKMLRQVLDNLIIFSKSQEDLLEDVKQMTPNNPNFGKKLTEQKQLEEVFMHVDDSLFALSQRNEMIGMKINEEISNVRYYLDKSMEQIAEFQMQKGQVSQQYTITAANELANLLSDALESMQNAMMMPGMGQGQQGQGFQLPDIIQKQKSLGEGEQGKSGQQGQQGQQPGQKPGSEGQSGEQGQNGQQPGQSGQSGGQGQSGENSSGQGGKSGQGGNGGVDGEEGVSYRQSETSSARLYQIYKQQQELRNQLEDRIRKAGLPNDVGNIVKKMKDIERKLLDQGYNRSTRQLMLNVHQELLKLQDASQQQGEEQKRQSETNRKNFSNRTNEELPDAAKYFNNKEILNRQILPLQPFYKKRVKQYFQGK